MQEINVGKKSARGVLHSDLPVNLSIPPVMFLFWRSILWPGASITAPREQQQPHRHADRPYARPDDMLHESVIGHSLIKLFIRTPDQTLKCEPTLYASDRNCSNRVRFYPLVNSVARDEHLTRNFSVMISTLNSNPFILSNTSRIQSS